MQTGSGLNCPERLEPMNCLFIFLDGVGLGADDPVTNPFAAAQMPNLEKLLDGRQLLFSVDLPVHTARASLLSLDAGLNVVGLPQSATGQAVLLTGINVPAEIGYHYGPKPNQDVAKFVTNGNLFHTLGGRGKRCALLGGYPPRYFQSIQSGRRMFSAIPLAASSAGVRLMDVDDIRAGRAISADLTGRGWASQPGFPDIPVLSPWAAGQRLAELGQAYDFAFFEYWLTDYAGHEQNMAQAVELLENFDATLGGLLHAWDDEHGLVLITSDHGNLEDLSTRRHTANPVPGLLIGSPAARQRFSAGLTDLSGVAGKVLDYLE